MSSGVKVTIRKNETGEEVDVPEPWSLPREQDDEDSIDYWWSEGNGSCDCNRYLYFERAKGASPDEAKCGDGRYGIRVEIDGETWTDELEPK